MKKLVFVTLIGFIVFGCSSLQPTVTPVSPEKVLVDTLTNWKQSYFQDIQIKDSVFFFNPDTVKIEKNFPKTYVFAEDGVVKSIDSLNLVSKIIPALTAGRWVSGVVSSSGEIKQMTVSFSRKRETTYNLSFIKQNDESFILDRNGYIVFRGYRYPVEVSTTGDCKLRFYYQKFNGIKITKEEAEGWKNKSETKPPAEDFINIGEKEPTIER